MGESFESPADYVTKMLRICDVGVTWKLYPLLSVKKWTECFNTNHCNILDFLRKVAINMHHYMNYCFQMLRHCGW